MEVTGTVRGSLTKRGELLLTETWELVLAFLIKVILIITELTAVHLIAGVLAVHFLVTLAGVGDAASISALELIG